MASGQDHNLHVRAKIESAQGFHELGMFDDAWKTLDDLSPEDISHPLVILLRIDLLMAQHRHDEAIAVGMGACLKWPIVDGFFVKTASALIDLSNYEKAMTVLQASPESLHKKAAYWFDLARCQCRLGEIERAKKSISKCINRDKRYKRRVLDDSDFDALWESL